ncbi:MAG: hypothetical protein COB59_11155 [Rhodospirillaceae bacterium]|nr:hypothetical protein [Candidatus Lindowbacteria bacterium]PHS76228.1 MAG: hypothetical protein COB59_11155 [Rhodospirillaceae bacterium]
MFDFDDLFITVVDKKLRAFNRLMFITANYLDKPILKSAYFECIRYREPNCLFEIETVKQQIKKKGLLFFRKSMKDHTNPERKIKSRFDARNYAKYTKPHISFYR